MEKFKYEKKAAKIAKRLKKARYDLTRGDKRAAERVTYHEQQQIIHKMTHG